MNTTRQGLTRLESSQSVLWFGLPLSFHLAFIIVTVIATPILALTTATRYAQPPSNPFSTYVSIFPGQPRSAVDSMGFICPLDSVNDVYIRSDSIEYCLLSLGAGNFSRIGVYVSLDNLLVEQVFFNVRNNALTLGDLTLLWGKPRVSDLNGQQFKLYWDDRDVWAQTRPTDDRFSMFLQVERVVFTKENM